MNNIYEHELYLCLEPRETDKNVLKFSKNWVLKFHFLLLGALQHIASQVHTRVHYVQLCNFFITLHDFLVQIQ